MDDQMSPDTSPGEVSKKVGIRRVNNMPVYIVGGVMAIFLLVMALVASDRAAKQNAPVEVANEKASNTTMFAKTIAGDQTDGIIPPLLAPPDVPNLSSSAPAPDKSGQAKGGGVPIARPDNLDTPPRPPISSQNPTQNLQLQPPRDDERDRMRVAKLQQFEEAAKAKTTVPQFSVSRNGGSSNVFNGTPTTRDEALARLAAVRQQIDSSTRDDPTAAYKARLQQIQASGLVGGGDTGASSAAPKLFQPAAPSRNDINQFAGAGQPDRWKLDSQPEAPRTPYELRAGFVIPAMLISGINSELPGQIMAQISQNVYDTATGKWQLIPQGSRLIGRYSSDVTFAQARVLIAWQRIVFPDGKAMDIGSMPGADSAGYSGFTDQVNNHYFRLFSSAFLLSGVTAGIAMSQPQTSAVNSTPTAGNAMSEALGQQLGQVTAQLISKNMNVAPTLEIRPGYRFNVVVTKDLTFSKPYQSFDY